MKKTDLILNLINLLCWLDVIITPFLLLLIVNEITILLLILMIPSIIFIFITLIVTTADFNRIINR